MKEIIGLGPTFGFGGPVDLADALPGVARPRRADAKVRTFAPKAILAQVLDLRPANPARATVRTMRPIAGSVARLDLRPVGAHVALSGAAPAVSVIVRVQSRPAAARMVARGFLPDVGLSAAVEARPQTARVTARGTAPKVALARSIIARPVAAIARSRGHDAVLNISDAATFRPTMARLTATTFVPVADLLQVVTARPTPATAQARTFPSRAVLVQPDVPIAIPNATLATGLTDLEDYSAELPFRNIMHQSRPWIADWSEGNDTVRAGGHLDANDWPVSIPLSGQLRAIWAFSADPYMDGTSWVVRWEGNGSIALGGSVQNVTVDEANRTASFRLSEGVNDSTFWLDVVATDPAPNNIRNIEVVREDWLPGYDAGEIFNPDFLAFVETMGFVRFMDWQCTNGSPQAVWADRAVRGKQTYGDSETDRRGVPLEDCIALCNRAQVPGWFCIPHQADDNYVTQMSRLIRDNLDSRLSCYIEYSNEVWNGSFDQHDYAAAQAAADWPDRAAESGYTLALNWAGKRMSQVFQIVNSVFAATPNRVRTVLAGQTGNPGWSAEQIAVAPMWLEEEPSAYSKPAENADHFAVTSYFGSGLADDPTFAAEVEAAYPATSDDVIQSYLTDPASGLPSLPSWRSFIIEASTEASKHGLSLLIYEGGAHIVMNNVYSDTLEAALLQHHKSAYQAENYEYLWNVWRNEVNSGGPFAGYLGIASWNGFGFWSLLEYPTQTPYPFAARLFELSASEAPWWVETNSIFARPAPASTNVRTFPARTVTPSTGAPGWSVTASGLSAVIEDMPAEPTRPTGTATETDGVLQIDFTEPVRSTDWTVEPRSESVSISAMPFMTDVPSATPEDGAASVAFVEVVLPEVLLQHMQLGAATDTSATVAVRGESEAEYVRLRYGTDPTLTEASLTSPVAPDPTTFIAKPELPGLTPGVTTYYQAVINGRNQGPIAQYTPVAEKQAANFKVAFSSCGEPELGSGVLNSVFNRIAAHDPDVWLSLGDTPYIDSTSSDRGVLRAAYNDFYAGPGFASLLTKTAHAYVWDDHDYGANGADFSSPSREASQQVYREYQPHYPLPDTEAIYHSFIRGRVKFIMLDGRSDRQGNTFLNSAQMSWLFDQLDTVADDPGLIGAVITSVVPWVSSGDSDTWAGAPVQRQNIVDYVNALGLQNNVMMIAGDAHMVAFDDGTNNQWGGWPMFHAAPLNRSNSTKGGPYTHGPFANSRGQYGVLDVTDDGTDVTITCSGYDGSDTLLVSQPVIFRSL